MKPIPVQFHIGPLLLHTYGIGLAVTFWISFRYFEHRLKARDFPVDWLPGVFGWVVVAAIGGARLMHVISNWGYYQNQPGQVLAVWHGGLSSIGGLLAAVPVGTFLARRRCPTMTGAQLLDTVAPVLVLGWAIGRLLGPQLMVAGGGRETTAWYGLAYAGQVGKRIPVPLIQSFDDFTIYALVLWIERSYRKRQPGFLIAAAAALYGAARIFEEGVFLHQNDPVGSKLVEGAGLLMVAIGVPVMSVLARRGRALAAAGPQSPARSAGPALLAGPGPAAADPQTSGGAEPEIASVPAVALPPPGD